MLNRQEKLKPEINRIVFVRNLPFKISAEDLYDLFGKYGGIRQIRKGNQNDTKGTAFVVYDDIYDAKTACEHLNGFNVMGRYLIVLYHHPSKMGKTKSLDQREQEMKELKIWCSTALQDHWSRIMMGNPASRRIKTQQKSTVQPTQAILWLEKQDFVEKEKTIELSLAQKLGILEMPYKFLQECEWALVKEAASLRNEKECPICQDAFRLQEQALLSCSHIFHRSCLHAYEKFSQKKQCPICRTNDYEKRIFFDGAKCCITRSVEMIQKHWRGYLQRKAYNEYRRLNPPTHPLLREKYNQRRFSKATELLEKGLKKESDELNAFLADIDQRLSRCKLVQETCLDQLSKSSEECAYENAVEDSKVDWSKVIKKAHRHKNEDCTICITKLNRRKITVLSCSHLFHTACIEAFEKYCEDAPQCPLCRQGNYQKRLIS